MNQKKKDLKVWIFELIEKNKLFTEMIEKEIDKLLDSGFIEPSDLEKDIPIHKIILYCALKRLAESYKPLGNYPQYKKLIKNY